MNINTLFEKINNNTACVRVTGLGYVGLPLSFSSSKKFSTVSFDVNEKYMNLLNSGKSYILDVQDTDLFME